MATLEIPEDLENYVLGDDGLPVKNKNGSYKRKPGPAKGTAPQSISPRKPQAGRRKPGKLPAKRSYAEGVEGLLNQVGTLFILGGKVYEPLIADGVALGMHAPPVAAAIADMADQKPEVARVLDKLLKVGPYGDLITAVMPLAMQLAANHMPKIASVMPGVHHPQALINQTKMQLMQQAMEAQQQAAEMERMQQEYMASMQEEYDNYGNQGN